MTYMSTLALVAGLLLATGCGTKDKADGTGKGGDSAVSGASGKTSGTMSPKEELRAALVAMKNATSYRATADLVVGEQTVQLEGSFGVNQVHIVVHRADGKVMQGVAVGDKAVITEDGEATWVPDDGKNIANLSVLVTGPIRMGDQIPDQGEVSVVGDEEVDGMMTKHYRVATGHPIDVWIGDGPDGKVVKKLKTLVDATDVDVNATIVFSRWNEPLGIEIPSGAP